MATSLLLFFAALAMGHGLHMDLFVALSACTCASGISLRPDGGQRLTLTPGMANPQCDNTALKVLGPVRAALESSRDEQAAIIDGFSDKERTFFDPMSCMMSSAVFESGNMRESGRSSTSGSIVRQRAFLAAIAAHASSQNRFEGDSQRCLKDVPLGRVYNTEAHGMLHEHLRAHQPDYVASEYLGPGAIPGAMYDHPVWGRVRHEDLTSLSFDSESIDLLLSAEVLEHIPNPYRAHQEIHRVLKIGGKHIFTVPIDDHLDADDQNLAEWDSNGFMWFRGDRDGNPQPPQYHGDPVNPSGGVLVYQIYGAREMLDILCRIGFSVSAEYHFDASTGVVCPRGVLVFSAVKVMPSEVCGGHSLAASDHASSKGCSYPGRHSIQSHERQSSQCDSHAWQALGLKQAATARAKDTWNQVVEQFADKEQIFFDPLSCLTSSGLFGSGNMRESGGSNTSGTIVRQRAYAAALLAFARSRDKLLESDGQDCLKDMALGSVYNTEAHGTMHDILSKQQADYVASEFLGPGLIPGSIHDHPAFGRVRHEDLTDLSFANESLDLVISAEVLEHVPNPYAAHGQIHRVLKKGGVHLFTVPINDNPDARDENYAQWDDRGYLWFRGSSNGTPLPPQFHGDPVNPKGGVLVYQIYGAGEMMARLCDMGFHVAAEYYFDAKIGVVSPNGILILTATKK
jgi:SAM-dependent methyltransferase